MGDAICRAAGLNGQHIASIRHDRGCRSPHFFISPDATRWLDDGHISFLAKISAHLAARPGHRPAPIIGFARILARRCAIDARRHFLSFPLELARDD